MAASQPKALPILDMVDDSNIQLHAENFNTVLDQVGDLSFAIISINGATRTGKSFAMNYFLRHLSFASGQRRGGQFNWNSGRERTTTGIDLWSEPFIVENNGRDVAILLMDTQGLLDDATSPTQNAVIFALSTFCSSIFIFNLKNNVTEDILQQINFYSDYARSVTQTQTTSKNRNQGPTNNGDYEGGQMRSPFQKIIYLIRDFDMPNYNLGCMHHKNGFEPRQNNSRNFFQEIFCPQNESRIHPDNLFVRKKLLETYNQMGMYLVPNPGGQFTRYGKLDQIDPEFVEAIERFAKMMTSSGHLLTKRVAGEEVSGIGFKPYIQELAALCEDAKSSFPPAQTLADVMAIQQHTLAIDTARSIYREKLDVILEASVGGISDEKLREEHLTLKKEALSKFDDQQKLGHPSMIRKSRESLEKFIDGDHTNAQHINRMMRTYEEQRQKDQAEWETKLAQVKEGNERDRAQQIQVISQKMDENAAKRELDLEKQRTMTAAVNAAKEILPVVGQIYRESRIRDPPQRDRRPYGHEDERYDYPRLGDRYRQPPPGNGGPYDADPYYDDDLDDRWARRLAPRYRGEGYRQFPLMADEYTPSSIRHVLAIGGRDPLTYVTDHVTVTRPANDNNCPCPGDESTPAGASSHHD